MVKNLDVDTFRNGDSIPEAKTDEEWKKAWKQKKPAWCYYDNDISNRFYYGKLYNWYALKDERFIAPEGWHVPTWQDWDILVNYLDPEADTSSDFEFYCLDCTVSKTAGGKLKNRTGWLMPNFEASNVTGFSALPGGYRDVDGNLYPNGGLFIGVGEYGFWWGRGCSKTDDDYCVWHFSLHYNNNNIDRESHDFVKALGLSIRLIKD